MNFVAPMAEQIGILTMHFLEVSGGTYEKFSSPKLGEMGQTEVFSISHVMPMGKVQPKIDVFQYPLC